MHSQRRSAKDRSHDSTPLNLLWSCLLIGVPLVVGLAINACLGWWSGLAAFLIAAVLTGVAAWRTTHKHVTGDPPSEL